MIKVNLKSLRGLMRALLCAAVTVSWLGFANAVEMPAQYSGKIPVPTLEAQRDVAEGIPYTSFSENGTNLKSLINAINATESSLDISIYHLTRADVVDALVSAANRGVKVRMILDHKHLIPNKEAPEDKGYQADSDIAAKLQKAGVTVKTMSGWGKYGTLHTKIAIFDKKILYTGSMNWTDSNDTNYENVLFLADKNVLKTFQDYYNQLWSVSTAFAYGTTDPLPALPKDDMPKVKSVGRTDFNGLSLPTCTFSPKGGTAWWIMKAIDSAQSSIDVAMFSFTNGEFIDHLSSAAARGVQVRLLLDKGQNCPSNQFSQIAKIKASKLKYRIVTGRGESGGEQARFHHKFAIFDNTLLSVGSYNWTMTGEWSSCEHQVFLTDENYVKPFVEEFNKLYSNVPTAKCTGDAQDGAN
ncbi:MAG: phosphatidylserine/phosphatidylglycerophosphate/cardiolipin synthase family protein [Elusimicrobia bacterium]|nr:phosphatidylserine/phosphatidylglycerophosphate/cardiolipin synthase family protein [Elusimicrobiota bacterium]